MICPEQSRSSYRSFRVESRSGPFWRAEARSGKGELLPILLDIAGAAADAVPIFDTTVTQRCRPHGKHPRTACRRMWATRKCPRGGGYN